MIECLSGILRREGAMTTSGTDSSPFCLSQSIGYSEQIVQWLVGNNSCLHKKPVFFVCTWCPQRFPSLVVWIMGVYGVDEVNKPLNPVDDRMSLHPHHIIAIMYNDT